MGVTTYLLDTHALLWLVGQPDRVPATVRDRLAAPGVRRLVSAVSAVEVATKTRLGKLPSGTALVESWAERVADLAAEDLPLTTRHALMAGSLRWDHRDPFDRMLAAQAISENATLVTDDEAMRTLPGLRTQW